jgi:hypothetical protein
LGALALATVGKEVVFKVGRYVQGSAMVFIVGPKRAGQLNAEAGFTQEVSNDVQVVKEVADAFQQISARATRDGFSLAEAIIMRDQARRERILGDYAVVADIASLYISSVLDAYPGADDYHKGKMSGRIFFEVALVILPAVKGIQAAKLVDEAAVITRASMAESIAAKILSSDFFQRLPELEKIAVSKGLARVRLLLGEAKKYPWVAHYARPGEDIFLAALEIRQVKQGLTSPVMALQEVEKTLLANGGLNAGKSKVLNAAMLDAVAPRRLEWVLLAPP